MSGVDRAALIEAALTAEHRQSCGCDGTLHADATWTDRRAMVAAGVDAVLPLVAQAIEDARVDHYAEYGIGDPRSIAVGYTRSARLVRSLAEEGQQQ